MTTTSTTTRAPACSATKDLRTFGKIFDSSCNMLSSEMGLDPVLPPSTISKSLELKMLTKNSRILQKVLFDIMLDDGLIGRNLAVSF